MICDEATTLMHALLDGELDAGHAREVDLHLAGCARCAAQYDAYRELRRKLQASELRFAAPASLHSRINRALPLRNGPSRRSLLTGFAAGTALSGAVAAGLVLVVVRREENARILGDALSAHLRSLRSDHLTDVVSSDQHTVKPWFNGRIDLAPPVVDLAAQDFALVGGRLDYIAGMPVGALVYRRRSHIINLFVGRGLAGEAGQRSLQNMQGFNILRWTGKGMDLLAVSDINPEELEEFASRFDAAAQ